MKLLTNQEHFNQEIKNGNIYFKLKGDKFNYILIYQGDDTVLNEPVIKMKCLHTESRNSFDEYFKIKNNYLFNNGYNWNIYVLSDSEREIALKKLMANRISL